jgi:Domain of unknown function (DUF4167)
MRKGQQNRRGRGRGRKPQNPLARSYESNGPDVKIRGTAAHIAEKYMSLARDALASGDIIAAESYLQHAEHYNRIIMAAQSQLGPQHGGQQGEGPNGGNYRPSWSADSGDDDGSDYDGPEAAGGGDNRPSGGGDRRPGGGGQDRDRQGGGGQDRERHAGDREHHGGGRDRGGRHGGNGSEAMRDANGTEPEEAQSSDESENENAPDTVS